MTEQRISALETHVTNMRIANEGLTASVVHLKESVDQLNETVQSLRDTVNQGRGALWLAMTASAAMGALLVVAVKRIMGIG